MVFAASSERPEFAIDFFEKRKQALIATGSDRFNAWSISKSRRDRRFAAERRIRWYVLHPGHEVSWPRSLVDQLAFASEDARVTIRRVLRTYCAADLGALIGVNHESFASLGSDQRLGNRRKVCSNRRSTEDLVPGHPLALEY